MARLPVDQDDADVWGPILNEYLTVAHDGGGTLKLSHNVRDFGAVGDATTDDTTAINAAITACTSSSQGSPRRWLYIPPGRYRFTSQLVFPSNVRVYGDVFHTGYGGSELLYDGAAPGTNTPVVKFGASGQASFVYARNIRVGSVDASYASGVGVEIINPTNGSMIEGVHVTTGFADGGFWLTNTGGGSGPNYCLVRNCAAWGAGAAPFWIQAGEQTVIVEGCTANINDAANLRGLLISGGGEGLGLHVIGFKVEGPADVPAFEFGDSQVIFDACVSDNATLAATPAFKCTGTAFRAQIRNCGVYNRSVAFEAASVSGISGGYTIPGASGGYRILNVTNVGRGNYFVPMSAASAYNQTMTLHRDTILAWTDGAAVDSLGPTIRPRAGSPEGAVTSDVGSVVLRTDGAANTTIYVKESGTGNTGWAPLRTSWPTTLISNDTIWDAKGDMVAATGPDAAVRVPVGTNNYVWTADSTQAAGVKWAPVTATVSKGTGTFLIAASNAPQSTKDRADYVCTGTNDHLTIQAAHDALPTGGGRIVLSEGQFNITAGQIRWEHDSSILQGMGKGITVGSSRQAACVGTRLVVTGGTGNAILVERAALDRTVHGVTFRDFTIDGNYAGTTVTGIYFRCDSSTIDNVSIWRMSGSGLQMRGFLLSEGAAADYDTYDCKLTNIYINQCTLDGIRLLQSSTDLQGTNVSVGGSGRDGMYMETCASEQFANFHLYGSGRHGLHLYGAGSRSKFVNFKIEGAADHLVVLDSTISGIPDVQFSNCGFMGIPGTTNTFDCMHLRRASGSARFDDLHVTDCDFGTYSGAALPRYGFNCTYGGLANLTFVGNSMPAAQFGTAPATFGTPAAGSIIDSNMGWRTRNAGVSTQTPGAVSTVNIAHGMAVTPTSAVVFPANAAARDATTVRYHVTVTSTNIVLTFSGNLAAATSYAWNWQAEKVY